MAIRGYRIRDMSDAQFGAAERNIENRLLQRLEDDDSPEDRDPSVRLYGDPGPDTDDPWPLGIE